VVLDSSGQSKGYGFIRFGSEDEQQSALAIMQGISGLGGKPIKVQGQPGFKSLLETLIDSFSSR
jgi:RNA recognition motif-containing protein